MSEDVTLSANDLIVLEAIVRGENRKFQDIQDATDKPEPLLRLTLATLREKNLVRFIGEGRFRRHVPTPNAWGLFNGGDDTMRRAEDRIQ